MSIKKLVAITITVVVIIATVAAATMIRQPENQKPVITEILANPLTGKAPLLVVFNVTAYDPDGSNLTYFWNFNDNTEIIKSQNVTHTFYYKGNFHVNLSVTDDQGSKTSFTKIITVFDYNRPVAQASANRTCGKPHLLIQFNGVGTDFDGEIKSYHWDFDDGETSSDQNPSHTFHDIGTYKVQFTVTDDEGEIGTDIIFINVIKNHRPKAYASAKISKGRAPLKVSFPALEKMSMEISYPIRGNLKMLFYQKIKSAMRKIPPIPFGKKVRIK